MRSRCPLRNLAAVALLLAAMGPGHARAQSVSKEEMHARMRSLAAQMASLKPRLATDAAASAAYAGLLAEYRQISASMGGDDPGQMGGGGASVRPHRVNLAPAAPPGCVSSLATFTNSTATPITDVATTTSTIVVSGAGTYLLDLDMTTFIQHTFAADLDITLTSPAGTVVTITTDNGAGNDNVFNGTVWDDSGGTPATDFTYTNLVTATPLVPEEAMGAFIGENPNGTWTLSITDDLAGDTGSLDSWSLAVTTLPAAPTAAATSATNSTATPIADVTTTTSSIVVAGAGTYLLDLNMTTFIQHTFSADLDITLTSPAGTVVTITTDNGAGNDNVFNGTVWDDSGGTPATDAVYTNLVTATPLVPEEAMAAFIGEDPNGTWTLSITDDLAGDTGTLTSWSLDIVTATCQGGGACVLTCPANITVPSAANQCGAVVNYPAPTTTGSCGPVICTAPSGSFFPLGTTTVNCAETGGTSTTTVYSTGNIANPIPATGTGPGSMTPSTIVIPDAGTITDLNLRIRLNHTFDSDLGITLVAPDGTTSVLVMDGNGGAGDNLGTGGTDCSGTKTIFDDQAATSISAGAAPFAGSFIPLNPLAAFNGMNAAGTWTLMINDGAALDSGTLFCWDLEVTRVAGAACSFTVTVQDTQAPTVTCPPNVNVTSSNGSGVPVTFPAPTVSDNCPGATATYNPPSGSTFPVGTTPVTLTATDGSGNTSTCTFNVTVAAGQTAVVPTLSEIGLAAFALLLAGVAIMVLMRR